MTITKAKNNLILEIDNQPALAVFAKLLKGPLAEDLRRALTVIFVGLPADRSENSVAPGKYLVRNIIGLDPDAGIVAVADQVSEGQSMIFTMRDGQRARDDLQEMLQRQLARLNGKKPAFGCYFNCCARGSFAVRHRRHRRRLHQTGVRRLPVDRHVRWLRARAARAGQSPIRLHWGARFDY